MRSLALLLSAAFLLAPMPALTQSVEIGPEGFRLETPRSGYGYCRELRYRCLHKEELGEVGEGNCRRYRETCRRSSYEDLCARLRSACMHKEELGEVGQ